MVKKAIVQGVMPRIGTMPTGRITLGTQMREINRRMGLPEQYWWQRHLANVSMELVPWAHGYRFAFDNVGAIVGRQSGKTEWAAARVVTQAMLPDLDLAEVVGHDVQPQHIGYLSQHRAAAVGKWLEHVELIEESGLGGEIKRIRRSNGEQVLEFKNRSWYRPLTPNRAGCRGYSLDLAILDEALTHRVELLSVLRPTMAQRDNSSGGVGAQFVVLSSAGDEDSTLLDRMTELGRASIGQEGTRRCWMEWSAEPDCDHLDEAVWRATLPTLEVPDGVGVEFIRSEAESMPEALFRREYLGIPSKAGRGQVIPAEAWEACHRGDVIVPADGQILGLDVNPERSRAALVVAGRVGDYVPIEVIEAREGVAWATERAAEVCLRWGAPLIVDVVSGAGALVPGLEALGVDVIPVTTRSVCDAAGMFYDLATQRFLAHLDDWRLNDAVAGSSKRAVGDRWTWDRKRSTVDISPLVAASLAVWGVQTGQGAAPSIH